MRSGMWRRGDLRLLMLKGEWDSILECSLMLSGRHSARMLVGEWRLLWQTSHELGLSR